MTDRLISKKEVCHLTGLARATIDRYRTPDYVHIGFPKPTYVGIRVMYSFNEVSSWVDAQLAKRGSS